MVCEKCKECNWAFRDVKIKRNVCPKCKNEIDKMYAIGTAKMWFDNDGLDDDSLAIDFTPEKWACPNCGFVLATDETIAKKWLKIDIVGVSDE